MLPMTLPLLIVMIASAINDRLRRKLGYVEERNAPPSRETRRRHGRQEGVSVCSRMC